MIRHAFLVVSLVVFGVCALGCSALLGRNASQSSLPVQAGIATTNDSQLVAGLKVAQQVASVVTPEPYSSPLVAVIGGIIALVSSLATSYQHRQIAAQSASIATQHLPPPTPPKV